MMGMYTDSSLDLTNMRARDIALIGLLSATITAGKLALSFIPNIEIVTLLFMVYCITFGTKPTLIVSIIFTTTEILLYGFSTWLIGYYIVWPVLVIIISLIKKKVKSEYGYAAVAGIFGLLYGLIFAAVESCFYGINYGIAYIIRGIPFDLVHGVSNFIIVLLLFNPLKQITARGKRIITH